MSSIVTAASWNAFPDVRWPWRRLFTALMVSAAAHYLIVEGWSLSGGVPLPVSRPLQAQLEIPPAAIPETPPVASVPLPVMAPAPARVRQTQPLPAAVAEPHTPPIQGAAPPDLRIYAARELDRFPVPLQPLDLRARTERAGFFRFWVSIDSTGHVIAVDWIPADLPASQAALLREWLLASRFMPGFKDERPVKSRILLELGEGF